MVFFAKRSHSLIEHRSKLVEDKVLPKIDQKRYSISRSFDFETLFIH